MNQSNFSLHPFNSRHPLKISITGNIHRSLENYLYINYLLAGQIDTIQIPSPVRQPTRLDNLWETTCLEFFLGIDGSSEYWEFNLSPSGNWNVYHFDDYRLHMQPEMAFERLPFDCQRHSNGLDLSIQLNLESIIPLDRVLEVAITAVIQSQYGNIDYWALSHPGKEADFHLRNGFKIALHSKNQ